MIHTTKYLLTYVEYRAVSDVFQNVDPPLLLASVSSHRTRRAVRRMGVKILEDANHRICLLQISPRFTLWYCILYMYFVTDTIASFE